MILRKKEFRLQKTELYKNFCGRKAGQIEWVTGFFFTLFTGILLCMQLQVKAYSAAALYIEDALAASNLAAAIIDVREYGISHNLIIADVQMSYKKYCEALQYNLQLNELWEGSNKALISGKVIIENFTIYNVTNNTVTVYCMEQNGAFDVSCEAVGSCRAPSGEIVRNTGIYSEISFPVEGMFGVGVEARKGKLVDVVARMD